MDNKEQLTPAKYRRQIKAYSRVFDNYKTYAEVLKRILENACKVSFPEAIIQTRPKSISSFAEKAARKFDKYPDAVNQMTDLCGARVIVQTTEQVRAVRQFIETNFEIVEQDDKGVLLREDRFGYRDMHYIVQLCPDRCRTLGIKQRERKQLDARIMQLCLDRCRTLGVKQGERKQIGARKAEIQVRTWVQHAWADTLHDRIYKNELKVSAELVRTGNLQAALMEEGDRTFDYLANELDGLIANYTSFATTKEVNKEIKVQELVLNNEPDKDKKPGLALKLARFYAAIGSHQRVVNLLNPYAGIHDANRCELLLTLGYSLCKLYRGVPSSVEYKRGRRLLEESLGLCGCKEAPFVPHLRKRESLYARALARLGWALEPILGEEHKARDCYQQAHEHEPSNPYYFAEMLGFEMHYSPTVNLPGSMRTTIREAIKTCEQHALADIEMPYAYFTAGRLSLLLGMADNALGYYARGIRYCLEGTHCIPADIFDTEIQWLVRIQSDVKPSVERQRVIDLFKLAMSIMNDHKHAVAKSAISLPILIIAGGAASIEAATIKKIRPLLRVALADFRGTVFAGGTDVGVPGCVGDVAHELARMKKKQFKLIGYLPRRISPHKYYDEVQRVGEAFVPDLILHNWTDILSARFNPQDVLLLGFGGGVLSAIEYRIALGLGASVGIVTGTGGTADGLLKDPMWSTLPKLYTLPFDSMTVRAFVLPRYSKFERPVLEEMAREFHACYVAGNTKGLPDNLKPWDKLNDSYKKANFEQVAYAIQILETAGFGVRKVKKPVARDFTNKEVELMAKLEHGRWNVERSRDGWRYGPRDDSKKLHNCLLPWEELPDGLEGVRKYDRDAVRAFPEILAKAGLEVYRLKKTGHKGRKFNKNKNRPRHRHRTGKKYPKGRKGRRPTK